ncbi:hypothetical protein CEXT_574831 [Caerostris extrusa]|uniref:Secreted protein n=1 Tax=Caerostris extrusa TaxID=172846 RepID=A0AAV4Y5B3_CAEEX|nr:hypothetical protein CEXT_574831 [Caerostris extrusa]
MEDQSIILIVVSFEALLRAQVYTDKRENGMKDTNRQVYTDKERYCNVHTRNATSVWTSKRSFDWSHLRSTFTRKDVHGRYVDRNSDGDCNGTQGM